MEQFLFVQSEEKTSQPEKLYQRLTIKARDPNTILGSSGKEKEWRNDLYTTLRSYGMECKVSIEVHENCIDCRTLRRTDADLYAIRKSIKERTRRKMYQIMFGRIDPLQSNQQSQMSQSMQFIECFQVSNQKSSGENIDELSSQLSYQLYQRRGGNKT